MGSAALSGEAAEEAYWRAWFWDKASEAVEEQFASAGKRALRRVREYIKVNRGDVAQGMPKKLRKHPHYEAEFEDIGKPLGWRTMPIYYRGERQASFPAEECPQTMGALGKLRLAGETVAFQRQSPGTGLPRHVDPCSWVVACHVGMVCPTGEEGGETPYISVAGEKYHWREGEVMVFDPSFKHETFNPTSQDRIILNIDLFHPELTDLECRETIRLKKELFGSTEAQEWRGP
ncbi:hypothetical protein EMIHUDRAFT_120510 [Emiliania huxleyi CCMP1516]|nr:hypothetical protein EMIHUDRAFT_120510 [Emiliania huxleyi CCMP1516]EOD10600.1 hypothetical protein EMIHUDRAFT_120510 [Emiliania huxleyi CCMP1516]|eukprot:XP_005763029.1 hypothetical protein EMIHUDRAFT_120510 [Emiliania huxleyi CCMP1516]